MFTDIFVAVIDFKFVCHFIEKNLFQSNKTHVDHQAEAYVAPRRVMAEANGNAIIETNGTATKVNKTNNFFRLAF